VKRQKGERGNLLEAEKDGYTDLKGDKKLGWLFTNKKRSKTFRRCEGEDVESVSRQEATKR